ncbi:cytochrome P450 [Methylocella silvestris BL2]|uniref:Cytochrome P450 n=1 Tax=Methylocella silvestris (strain DSM 15510 / CIP 108128 / LMG 27833 / NCIMB 13906 / BL2) TaxID=395965 RepID=B8EPB4_METSB|nr:cytochrome P450 [Methylocella silvestris]ACK49702.1 cytochrome P450 [Methylocella silvestris BL2]
MTGADKEIFWFKTATRRGPRGWPLLGILPHLRRDVLKTVREACAYGDLVELKSPLFSLLLLNSADHVARVLQTNSANYGRTRFHAMLKPVLGNGLLTSEGDLWRAQRRIIQPAFLFARLPAYAVFEAKALARLCQRWEQAARSQEPVDVAAEMSALSVEVIVGALFGDSAPGAALNVRRDINLLQDYITGRFWSVVPAKLAELLPTAGNLAYQGARQRLDRLIYSLIEAHRQTPVPGAILSLMLDYRDPETGAGMGERQIRDEVMTLFLAGHETTATALTWLWLLLAENPESRARVEGEADAAQGLAGNLPEQNFIKRAAQEALRLYPPIWSFSRHALGDDMLGEHFVGKDSNLMVCPYTLHRHPDYWTDPERFDPDRFLPARAERRPRFAYVPFGGGPRICVGGLFALAELVNTTTTIAARFRLEPISADVQPEALVTLRPKGGLLMKISER